VSRRRGKSKPAALLEIPDKYAVIRAQWPTAPPLLAVNILLMNWLAFRRRAR
jgi:uncharacterized membrane protein